MQLGKREGAVCVPLQNEPKVSDGGKASCKAVCTKWYHFGEPGGRGGLISGRVCGKQMPLERKLCAAMAEEQRSKLWQEWTLHMPLKEEESQLVRLDPCLLTPLYPELWHSDC